MYSILASICALSLYIVSSNRNILINNDVNPLYLQDMKTSFYSVLDHNNDGIITTNEIALGILSPQQSQQSPQDLDLSTLHIPEEYTCIPSLDFVDFIDCISIAARHQLSQSQDIDTSKEILFEDIFNDYIGECTDISPSDNEYCYDIIQESPESCMKWSRTNQNYCQLSCYSCQHEPVLFDQHLIRGLNGKYRPRKERLSTYYPPQEVINIQVDAAQNCTAVKDDGNSGQILFISDIHIEPWYNTDGSGEVSRFSGCTVDNMFTCHNKDNKEVNCTLNGESDPPYPLWYSGMNWLRDHADPQDLTQTILIMGGDTQAHSYTTGTPPLTEIIPPLINKVQDELLTLFKSENIFYAAGNNDGQHNIIFASGSDPAVNTAWAKPFIKNGIVNNGLNRVYNYKNKTYDSVTLFNSTGYYIKKIPEVFNKYNFNKVFYAIILNTNLGLNNDFQNTLFNQDLAWIKSQSNGSVLVIGHHPNVVSAIIPKEYQDMVKGSYAGHVHYFQPTDSDGFTILPATTQYASYSAVLTGDLDKNGDIVMSWDNNFNQYLGEKDTLAVEDCWGYKGKPTIDMTHSEKKKEHKAWEKKKKEIKKKEKKNKHHHH